MPHFQSLNYEWYMQKYPARPDGGAQTHCGSAAPSYSKCVKQAFFSADFTETKHHSPAVLFNFLTLNYIFFDGFR